MMEMTLLQGAFLVYSFIMLLATHELAHAVEAKWEGIFKGFGFSFAGVCVHLTRPSVHRSAYLLGMVGSLITWPFWFFAIPIVWLGPVMALACGAADLFVFFGYGVVREKALRLQAAEREGRVGLK